MKIKYILIPVSFIVLVLLYNCPYFAEHRSGKPLQISKSTTLAIIILAYVVVNTVKTAL